MLIKETEHLILNYINCPENDTLIKVSYKIYAKYQDYNRLVATIYRPISFTTGITTECTSNLQNCITSWEIYKEFIMLVDEAYDLLGGE